MATFILGVMAVILMCVDIFEIGVNKSIERTKYEVIGEITEFAVQNNLETVCDINERVCCNLKTKMCRDV